MVIGCFLSQTHHTHTGTELYEAHLHLLKTVTDTFSFPRSSVETLVKNRMASEQASEEKRWLFHSYLVNSSVAFFFCFQLFAVLKYD